MAQLVKAILVSEEVRIVAEGNAAEPSMPATRSAQRHVGMQVAALTCHSNTHGPNPNDDDRQHLQVRDYGCEIPMGTKASSQRQSRWAHWTR